jgi:serine/threonine protein phosphatase PrpC
MMMTMTMTMVGRKVIVVVARSALSWRVTVDGLWNYFSNETSGRLAARTCVDGSPARSPEQAVSELMEHCLQHGGYYDDMTILMVDVTIPS